MQRKNFSILLFGLIGIATLMLPLITTAKEAVTNLSNTPTDSRFAALAVAATGTRHVVWEETVSTSPSSTTTYLLYRAGNGITWSPTITLTTGSRAALATGPDSNAHLAWVDEFNHTLQVFYSHWNGTTWSAPRLIAPGLSGNATAPALIVDTANTVHVSWGQAQPGYKLYYAESAAGGTGTWSASPVPNAAGTAPSIALDATSHVHLAWQEKVNGFYDVFYAQLNGATWTLPENVSQSSQSDSRAPTLAVAGDNHPIIAWSETIGAQSEILAARRTMNGWPIPLNLSNSALSSTQPRLLATQGGFMVAWNEATTPNSIEWVIGNGLAWSPVHPLVTGASNVGDVALAAGAGGRVHYTYGGVSGSNGDIFYDVLTLPHRYMPVLLNTH